MKVNDIDQKVLAFEEKISKLCMHRDEAQKLAEEYSEKAEAFAVKGDVDNYMATLEQANKQKAIAYTMTKHIESLCGDIDESEAKEAWKEYAESFNKTLIEMKEDFSKEKQKLAKKYSAMIDLQNKALKVRERLASYLGVMPDDRRIDLMFMMEYMNNGTEDTNGVSLSMANLSIHDPDAVYYLSTVSPYMHVALNSKESETVNKVVRLHRATE